MNNGIKKAKILIIRNVMELLLRSVLRMKFLFIVVAAQRKYKIQKGGVNKTRNILKLMTSETHQKSRIYKNKVVT